MSEAELREKVLFARLCRAAAGEPWPNDSFAELLVQAVASKVVMAKLLAGAECDCSYRGVDAGCSQSAVHHAATCARCSDSLRALLQLGCPADSPCAWRSWTPLHVAAAYGNAEGARLLLEAGANPNAVSRAFDSPMRVALVSCLKVGGKKAFSNDLADVLLVGGAKPAARDLDIALRERYYGAVKRLVCAGAALFTDYAKGALEHDARAREAATQGARACVDLLSSDALASARGPLADATVARDERKLASRARAVAERIATERAGFPAAVPEFFDWALAFAKHLYAAKRSRVLEMELFRIGGARLDGFERARFALETAACARARTHARDSAAELARCERAVVLRRFSAAAFALVWEACHEDDE